MKVFNPFALFTTLTAICVVCLVVNAAQTVLWTGIAVREYGK